MGGSHLVVERSGFREREDQRIGGQGTDGVDPGAAPGRLRSQCLILAQHLHQADHLPGHMALAERRDTGMVHIARHLYHQVVWEVGEGAAIWHVDLPYLRTLVIYRVTDSER